jgi:hypothetical protein
MGVAMGKLGDGTSVSNAYERGCDQPKLTTEKS